MSSLTTFRVGGPADCVFEPANEREIIAALDIAKEESLPTLVIGNGSNLIVRDGGFRGLIIRLCERFSRIDIDGERLTAQAGASMARVSMRALEAGLTGLEFASGIPGTIGGGCAMNAGAYGGQLSDCLLDAQVLTSDGIVTMTRDDMQMGYRSTRPLREGGFVLSARFQLQRGNADTIAATMRDLNARRREKQPLNYPSAGSTFKRPVGYFAGGLIEQAGLKGRAFGGAQVSEKHAGFIINTGNATATDILSLIRIVQEEVFARAGVRLETEVRIVGED